MAIKIEVKDPTVKNRQGVSKSSGKPYSINSQQAYVHIPGKAYPVEFVITLDDGQMAYQPGIYTLDDSSIYVDRFGGLTVGRVKLLPVARASAA